jgi:hypothetical protein
MHNPYAVSRVRDVHGLPATLTAPPFVKVWQSRAMIVGAVAGVLSLLLGFLAFDHFQHFLRAWLMGFFLCLGWCLGGMALLMVQYLSGGKWGLILRRPLEAMTRTFPLVALYFLPIGIFGASFGQLYLWGRYADPRKAFAQHLITSEQAHALIWKRPMLNNMTFWIVSAICFAIWGTYIFFLNKWGADRERDPEPNVPFWQKRFENLSGFGVLIYCIALTALSIYCVMSLDPTWYSTVYGWQFMVGQGYGTLALVLLTTMALAQAEPMRTMFRPTEQQDIGKLCFAFTMLNMYLAFAAFLIIWSGNSPEEIPWFLNRFRGGWSVVATFDVIFHWLLPFSLLLSRSLKRNRRKLAITCCIMIWARCWDLWWLIEPNFPDAARHLHFSVGMLEYLTVPTALAGFWMAFYFRELQQRPLIQRNDPHTAEIVEALAEAHHAHA